MILINFVWIIPVLSQSESSSNDWLAEIVWNDENGLGMDTVMEKSDVLPFSISENVLTMPFTESNDSLDKATSGNISFVWHTSSVKNGSWNFDIFLSNQQSSLIFYQIIPIAGISFGNWSQVGKSSNDVVQEFKILSICIIQGNYDGWAGGQNEWRFILRFFDRIILQHATKSIGENDFNEWHHVNITRSTIGEIIMFFDSEAIFDAYAANAHFQSDYFGISSFDGLLKIANVAVKDSLGPDSWSDNFEATSGSNNIPFSDIFVFTEDFLVIGLIRFTIKKKRI